MTIEQAYQTSAVSDICCNPTFFHEPVGLSGERIRLIIGPRASPTRIAVRGAGQSPAWIFT